MCRVIRHLLIILFFLGFIAFVQPIMAQDSGVSDDEVNEVARDIYCPVCESTPLDVCATQACADWRELIRTKLGEGDSKDEIFEYFARQYGDGVLSNPPRRGISLIILWISPVVVLLVGVLLFSRWMRNLRAAPTAAAPDSPLKTAERQSASVQQSGPAAQEEYLARIEKELGKKQ
jgi:cytochrome c-type biogenesis protein CcmH